MERVFEIATSVASPLALGGFFAAVVFFIFRQIIAKNIFPSLTASHGAAVLRLIIERLFVLALVAMILGFIAYLVLTILPKQTAAAASEASVASRTITVPLDPAGFTNIGPFSPNQYSSLTITGRWSPGFNQPYVGPEGSSIESLRGYPKWAVLIEYTIPETGMVYAVVPYPGHSVNVMPNMKMRLFMNDEPGWMRDNTNDPDSPMKAILRQ
jgi:cbb3-type cytochrome oxidase subunit 3